MELPQGDQVLAGVKFRIGEGLIHLASKQLPDRPERVEEIPVNTRFSKLYVLHGMGFGPRFGVKDGTNIGHYVVRYEDETTDMIPIIYGEHVRDWWNVDNSQPTNSVIRGVDRQ